MPAWQQLAAVIIPGVAAVIVGWLSGRSQTRGKAIEGATPSYTALDARVARLEEQVSALLTERTDLLVDRHETRTYMRVLIAERPPGTPLPDGAPAWLTPGNDNDNP